jgi:hypothetical protein
LKNANTRAYKFYTWWLAHMSKGWEGGNVAEVFLAEKHWPDTDISVWSVVFVARKEAEEAA